MSGQIPRPTGSIILITVLLVLGMCMGETADTAWADDCIAAPNSSAPVGSHWYYRVDRVSQRKCWYLRATDQPAQHTAAKRTSDTASATTTTAREKPTIDSASAPTSMNPGGSTEVPVPRAKPQGTLVSTATTVEPAQKSAKQRSPAQSTELATASASAPMPTAANDTTPSLRGVTVPSAQMSGAATDQSVRLSVQNKSAVSSVAAAAAQPNLSPQVNGQEGASTLPAWPNPPTGVEKMEQSTGPSSAAQAEAGRPIEDAGAPTNAKDTAQAVTTNPSVASLASTPVTIFPVAALGLVVAGFLLRILVKIFVVRRHRITVDHHDFDLVNDRDAHALPDDQIVDQQDRLSDYLQRSDKAAASKSSSRRPSAVSDKRMNDAPDTLRLQTDKIDKRERRSVGVDSHESEWIDAKRRQSKRRNDEQRHEPIGIDPRQDTPIDDQQQRWRHDQHQRGAVAVADELIDDLQSSLMATRRDYCPGRSFRDSLNEGGGRDTAPVDEIREHEEGLEQLRRSLDRLLQSPNVP